MLEYLLFKGEQAQRLQKALIDAFPDKSSLEQMLFFQLNKGLDEFAGGDNLETIVFQLIKKARAENWVVKLIIAARKSNPGNQLLKDISAELLPELQTETATHYENCEEFTNEFWKIPQEQPGDYHLHLVFGVIIMMLGMLVRNNFGIVGGLCVILVGEFRDRRQRRKTA